MKNKYNLSHKDGLPANSKNWKIEDRFNTSLWCEEADFYNTRFYSLEGLNKPISLLVNFSNLNKKTNENK